MPEWADLWPGLLGVAGVGFTWLRLTALKARPYDWAEDGR